MEMITRILFVALVSILLIVLYNRLLKALGKGKYNKKYAEFNDAELNKESSVLEIVFDLPRNSPTKLEILDASSETIEVLVDTDLEARKHTFKLDCSNMKSGKYSYRLTTEDQSIYKYFNV